MKRFSLLLALLMALSLANPAFAQEVSLQEVFKAPGERLQMVDTDMDEPLIEARKEDKVGIYNAQGELIIPFEYGFIHHLGNGLFEVIKEDGVDTHGLINDKNELVIGYEYGAYEIISPELVAAVSLELATGEVYDYAGGFLGSGDKYLVHAYDIYNVTTKEKLGSFTREQYEAARAVDGHLAVRDRDDKVTIYDMALQPVGTADYLFSLPYELRSEGGVKSVVGKYSGQVLADNVPYESISTSGDDSYIMVRGEEGAGLLDASGLEVVPPRYQTVYSTTGKSGYMVVSTDNLKGISDLKGNLLVPVIYNDILMKNTRVVHGGYALVEQDGKLGFVNLKGEVTLPITYNKSAIHHGASLSMPDMDGSLHILAADGTTTRTDYESFEQYYSNGLILKGKKGDTTDIVDWHGKVLLGDVGYAAVDATKAGTYVLYEDTLYKINLE